MSIPHLEQTIREQQVRLRWVAAHGSDEEVDRELTQIEGLYLWLVELYREA